MRLGKRLIVWFFICAVISTGFFVLFQYWNEMRIPHKVVLSVYASGLVCQFVLAHTAYRDNNRYISEYFNSSKWQRGELVYLAKINADSFFLLIGQTVGLILGIIAMNADGKGPLIPVHLSNTVILLISISVLFAGVSLIKVIQIELKIEQLNAHQPEVK